MDELGRKFIHIFYNSTHYNLFESLAESLLGGLFGWLLRGRPVWTIAKRFAEIFSWVFSERLK